VGLEDEKDQRMQIYVLVRFHRLLVSNGFIVFTPRPPQIKEVCRFDPSSKRKTCILQFSSCLFSPDPPQEIVPVKTRHLQEALVRILPQQAASAAYCWATGHP